MHLPDAMVERIVARFRALADSSRVRLLLHLKEGECNVNGLVDAVGIGQASVSKHLAQLKQAGLVQVRRDGNQAFYSIRDPAIFTICSTMCSGIEEQVADELRAMQREA
jgi:DNA-binding transcriptional ArsR family regulator